MKFRPKAHIPTNTALFIMNLVLTLCMAARSLLNISRDVKTRLASKRLILSPSEGRTKPTFLRLSTSSIVFPKIALFISLKWSFSKPFGAIKPIYSNLPGAAFALRSVLN